MKETGMQQFIAQVILSTLEVIQIRMDVRPKNDGINMSYHFINHYIGFDENRLQKAKLEMSREIALIDYIKVLTMHELGHVLDREALLDSLPRTKEIFDMKRSHSLFERYNNPDLLAMVIEEHRTNISFEMTAWLNAENLNREYELVNTVDFDYIKNHSLRTYTILLEEDLRLYDSCTSSVGGQIA